MGNDIKRMKYLNGLLLTSEDYSLDKEYQRRLLGLHNRYLHTYGIASGLEVKPVIDSNMEVYVTEGFAIDITSDGLDGADIKESISRQIVIYEGHPDNPIDLSEYKAGEDIYIYLNYYESNADWDSEKGQGNEIHIWELGRLRHSTTKPKDTKKNILLARVRPKEVRDSKGNIETVIDNQCIYYTDIDGTQLRTVVGSQSKALEMNKISFKLGEDSSAMPVINATTMIIEESKVQAALEIDSEFSNFTGNVNCFEDIIFEGVLICQTKDGETTTEASYPNSYFELNSFDEKEVPNDWKPKNGGLDVFRGGPGVAPDARIAWSENEKVWKAGFENSLSTILYGPKCENLISNTENCDELHSHSSLSSKKRTVLKVESDGILSLDGNLVANNKKIIFSSESKKGELLWQSKNNIFGQSSVDGPVFIGVSGGVLGTTSGQEKAVLSWNSKGKWGKVGIGSTNLSRTDDDLDVAGSCRILADSNPIRMTSTWTAFPDKVTNHAEICNDTTYHKALMIVGNQSAGQGRKVSIWDNLDVAGLMYVNGIMETSGGFKATAGSGNNGIIFPSNPGGGTGDSAWIKYYQKNKNDNGYLLEIGTSNDRDDNISLNASGSVLIRDTSDSYDKMIPIDKFDVSKEIRILSQSNPIRFTGNWSSFTDKSPNFAEISNDNSSKKSLMIAGNRSGGNQRKVKVFDDLDVNGALSVKSNVKIKGALIPGIGNCDVKGILFKLSDEQRKAMGLEKEAGDAAWIRYYSDTTRGGGGNMTLEIGISNDSNIETRLIEEWVVTCPWGIPNGCGYWNRYYRTFVGNGGDRLLLRASGGVFVEGNFYVTSTKEYKENIKELSETKALAAINSLNPVEFNFKGDSKVTMGFIAEEVSSSLAAYDKKAIDPMEIITVLVKEVKSQETELKALQKKIATLKRRKK